MQLGEAWGTLRGLVRNHHSFSDIKDLVGAAGLPIHRLAHLHQRLPGMASKGQLMDAIDALVGELAPEDQDRFVAGCVRELLRLTPALRPFVEEALATAGWGLSGLDPHPLRLQIDLELTELPAPVGDGLKQALRRYRDGDASGAITSICGVVDTLTRSVYEQRQLGDPFAATYQERVAVSFSALEAEFRAPLTAAAIDAAEVDLLWHNQRQALNQAGYVLGSFRRSFADAHGVQEAPRALVQRALDCAVFIVRTIAGVFRPPA